MSLGMVEAEEMSQLMGNHGGLSALADEHDPGSEVGEPLPVFTQLDDL